MIPEKSPYFFWAGFFGLGRGSTLRFPTPKVEFVDLLQILTGFSIWFLQIGNSKSKFQNSLDFLGNDFQFEKHFGVTSETEGHGK